MWLDDLIENFLISRSTQLKVYIVHTKCTRTSVSVTDERMKEIGRKCFGFRCRIVQFNVSNSHLELFLRTNNNIPRKSKFVNIL